MTSPKMHQSFTVDGIELCCLIGCATSDRVWVSDWKQFILTKTTEGTLKKVNDWDGVFYNSPFVFSTEEHKCARFVYGLHTVNSEIKLIYIDWIGHFNLLSNDMKIKTLFT